MWQGFGAERGGGVDFTVNFTQRVNGDNWNLGGTYSDALGYTGPIRTGSLTQDGSVQFYVDSELDGDHYGMPDSLELGFSGAFSCGTEMEGECSYDGLGPVSWELYR